jgi:colanic acid/amylovoran biosynthesis glycosyltransferase
LGIETHKVAFVPRRWISGTPLRVLIAATFTEKKGIPDALAAIARVAERTAVEITIIGAARRREAKDQRELARIQKTVDTFGLNVCFLGYQPHARLLEEAYSHHVFLSPSVTASDGDSEGGAPVTIIEMAASGMPVVSTFHCDIPNVIRSGVSGLLAEEHDVDQLAEHIRWLTQNPEGWLEMVRSARQRIDSDFDARLQGLRLAAIYEDVIQSNSRVETALDVRIPRPSSLIV